MFEYPEFLSPVAFEFFGLAIRWYSLSYILGFTYFYIFAASHLNDFNLDKKKLDDLFFYLFLSVIIGGRLGYVIFYNFSFYSSNPLDILKVWEGGMSFHGALFGIIFTTILFTKIYSIKLFLLSDLLSITAPLGDLIASAIKREAGVKDSGVFLPGHGGALDRLDSFITAAPVALILYQYLS